MLLKELTVNITIIGAGHLKEKYLQEACGEYSKRLGRYCRLQIIEVQDEPTPDKAGAKTEKRILDTEGEKILRQIPDGSFCIATAIKGKRYSSEGFAGLLQTIQVEGHSHITFVIGGSLGLSEKVLQRADLCLSFSEMTFPHQLMRVILLEQIYRGFRIIHHEPYHK